MRPGGAVSAAQQNIPQFGGTIYYVSANSGNDANTGLSPNVPLATIGAAIAKLTMGDAVNIEAGTYTETGLDLNVNGCELWFELGAVIDPATGTALTVSGNYCRVTCPGGSLLVTPAQDQTGVLVTGNFVYLNEIRVNCDGGAVGTSADIGYDIQGNGADLRRCRCADPDVAAFKVQGDRTRLENCVTGGSTGYSSIGYWITNSCDKFRLEECGSQGNETAGYQVDTGCTNGVISNFYSGGGDGKCTDADNATVISEFSYPETKYKEITLTATGGVGGTGTNYNLFKITGAVKVFNVFGHVTTQIANDGASLINLELYSTNNSVDVTDAGGAPDIANRVVDTVFARESDAGDPLEVGEPAGTPAVVENANFRTPRNPVILIEDNGADTYLQMQLSNNTGSGVIHWHIEWEPITDNGFVEPA